MIRFKATEVNCEEIKPGDAFSNIGPDYWDHAASHGLGERVYLRTNTPINPADVGQTTFRIEVEEVPGEAN